MGMFENVNLNVLGTYKIGRAHFLDIKVLNLVLKRKCSDSIDARSGSWIRQRPGVRLKPIERVDIFPMKF